MQSPFVTRQSFVRTVLMTALAGIYPIAGADVLHEVIVTADLREVSEMRLPTSVSVVDSETVTRRAAQHLEDVFNTTPNVNFAGGASRGRFVQIRGVGERSQFIDPVNPAVGLVIDGIDFSGVGNAGLLYDIGQVEVLRGPQGTRFGANGMAGMLVLVSEAPQEEFEGELMAEVANYDSHRLAGMLTGPLSDSLQGRLAVSRNRGDGYQHNRFLGRRDVADFDETMARARFDWQVSSDFSLGLSLFHIDVDNGYDGFSLDNTRTTWSDEPGHDRQRTTAASLNGAWALDPVTIEGSVTWENTDTNYGFDEDWTFAAFCDVFSCLDDPYSSTDTYRRDRKSYSIDLRLLSTDQTRLFGNTDWLAGIYFYQKEEGLQRDFLDWNATWEELRFITQWDVDRVALYAQTDTDLTDSLRLGLGARWERFEGDYRDSMNVAARPNEDMWGGQVSLEYLLEEQRMVYALVSRGYKTGGVNGMIIGFSERAQLDPSVRNFLNQRTIYETESLLNYEIGFKGRFLDERLAVRATAFYMDRDDIQLKGWYNAGPLFVEFLDNAGQGVNRGIELESDWHVTDNLTLFASLGLLDTEIKGFLVNDPDVGLVDRSGREQAHAPSYQFNLGFNYDWDQWFLRVDLEGKDSFYFSDSHNQASSRYTLLHAQLGYDQGPWRLALWGRNLADKDYPVRGFYFANDPRNGYINEPYYQYGEPRRLGFSATYRF